MSIASELDSTIENIKSDYEGLENIGADLTNVNKNIQNIRTCLDNIYDNLPKTTGEGSNLSLTTLKGRINVGDIKGDTQQDTYEGYNLLVYPYDYLNGNGTSLDKNIEGDLEVTGTTTTSGMAHFFLTDAVELKTNTTYTITRTIETLSGTATSITGQIELYIGTTWKKAVLFPNQTSTTFRVDDNATYRILFKLGSLSETSKFKISNFMIYEGTGTKPFEKYVGGTASPNPTYPQDINVVTGTQEVVVQNANLLEMSLLTTISGNRYISSGSNHIKVAPNTTYTFSVKSSTGADGLITLYDDNGSQTQTISQSQASRTSVTFTTGANDSYFILNRWYIDSTAITVESTEPMLNVGSTASSYVEHQEQTKTLHLGDIELAKIGTYQDRIFESSGKNLTDIVLNGSVTGEITYKTYTLQPNTQYTISTNTWVTSTSTANVFADSGTSFSPSSASNGVNGSRTITSDNNGNITIGYRNVNMSMDYSSGKYWIMLNLGSSALPYEPYGSDKWYIEKNIGHKKASEITENNIGLVQQGVSFYNTGAKNDRTLQVYSNVQTWKNETDTEWNTLNGNYIGILYNVSQIYINKTASVKSEILTWLNSINFEMYYVLATPTYTEITNETLQNELNELEKMMSYNGTTNISVSGNLPMILDVSALKGE